MFFFFKIPVCFCSAAEVHQRLTPESGENMQLLGNKHSSDLYGVNKEHDDSIDSVMMMRLGADVLHSERRWDLRLS